MLSASSFRSSPWTKSALAVGFAAIFTLCPPAHAAASGEMIDVSMIASLEQRADQAAPRDRVYLLTELADRLTVLAAAQLHSGEIDQATATLNKVEICAQKIDAQMDAKSKDLKKAEMRLHQTERRLNDLARVVSGDMKLKLQSTLKKISETQRSFLTVMFSN